VALSQFQAGRQQQILWLAEPEGKRQQQMKAEDNQETISYEI
jgi:hypothetical protein